MAWAFFLSQREDLTEAESAGLRPSATTPDLEQLHSLSVVGASDGARATKRVQNPAERKVDEAVLRHELYREMLEFHPELKHLDKEDPEFILLRSWLFWLLFGGGRLINGMPLTLNVSIRVINSCIQCE